MLNLGYFGKKRKREPEVQRTRMGYCPFSGLCRDRECWFPVATRVGLRREIPVATRHCTSRQCLAHDSACACYDRRPWVGRRSSFAAIERATTEARARAGTRRYALGTRTIEEFYRDREFSVATGFSHYKPGGLGGRQSAHNERNQKVLACDKKILSRQRFIVATELSSSQKKKII